MSELISKHGGYRNLKTFQLAQLVYDVAAGCCKVKNPQEGICTYLKAQLCNAFAYEWCEYSSDSGVAWA